MLTRLLRLPRDARDTLFLLSVTAWLVLPHVSHIPLWCSLLTASMLLWRAALAVMGRPLPSRWWLLGLLAVASGATWFSHRTLLGRDAGVTLIIILLALKLLELRARRDAFVVFFLGFFTLLTNFFYSQSLLTAGAMLLALLGLLTALVNAHMPVGKPPLLHAARIAGSMALLGAPIMAVLFLLFPRVAPLWGIPSDAMTGRSGLSSTMSVGSIAKLALDDSIAMRIRFEGKLPSPSELYFRGPVLSSFDGREWRVLQAALPYRQPTPANLQVSGTGIRYQVTLEPNSRPWFLLLDATPGKPVVTGFDAAMTPDLQWIADRPITDLLRYDAQSYPDFRHGPMQAVMALQNYLALPQGANPRTAQLASEMRADPRNVNADGELLIQLVLDRLRHGDYHYTLEPGVYGQHTADEFWFDRKEGFCEHIASSFVILMRALGLPARIVTGYQGGEINPVDGYLVVRQSDAHAWAEVWLAGRGWLRVDPTSVVAPGRTGAMQRLAVSPGVFTRAWFGAVNPDLAFKLRSMWEAVNNGWNQWVLNYTQGKQFDLLRAVGFASPSWEDLSYLLIGVVVLTSLAGAARAMWDRRRHDPWLQLLAATTGHLKKLGFCVVANSPPRRLAEQLQEQCAPNDPLLMGLRPWLLRLEAQRYGRHSGQRSAVATLRDEFKQLIRRQ